MKVQRDQVLDYRPEPLRQSVSLQHLCDRYRRTKTLATNVSRLHVENQALVRHRNSVNHRPQADIGNQEVQA